MGLTVEGFVLPGVIEFFSHGDEVLGSYLIGTSILISGVLLGVDFS